MDSFAAVVAKEVRVFVDEEARRFLDVSKDSLWGLVFKFALETGMRREEYLGLKWGDVDLDRRTATVQRTLCWKWKARDSGGDPFYFGEDKTAKSRRTLPLSASLVDELRHHKDFQQITRKNFGERYKDLDLVFTMPLGAPVNTDILGSKYFRPVLEKAGLPSTVRLNDLRHTMATLLLLAGENPRIVGERMGHSSVAITLDIYSHVLPTMQESATSKLERLLLRSDTLLTHRPENTKGSEDIVNPLTLVNKGNNESWEAGIRIQPRQESHRRQAG